MQEFRSMQQLKNYFSKIEKEISEHPFRKIYSNASCYGNMNVEKHMIAPPVPKTEIKKWILEQARQRAKKFAVPNL